jgi:antitoxin ParD1/3/4
MIVELDRETGDRIQQEVEAGRFTDARELVAAAVDAYLREPDVLQVYTREEIEAKIDRGLAELDAGQGIDGEEFFRGLCEKSARRRQSSGVLSRSQVC